MALTERYCNPDLGTGSNDGTSEADAWQSLATAFANISAGQRLNLKRTSSPVTLGADLPLTNAGTATSPIHVRGYGSTIGDGARFQIDGATNNYRLGENKAYVLFEALEQTYGSRTPSFSGDFRMFLDCHFQGTGIYAPTFTGALLRRCSITATPDGTASYVTLSAGMMDSCFVSGLGIGATASFNAMSLRRVIVTAAPEHAIKLTMTSARGVSVVACIVYDADTDGIYVAENSDGGASPFVDISENIIYLCGRYGINNADSAAATAAMLCAKNAFGSCSSGNTTGLDFVIGSLALTADPFEDAPNDDFNLNNDAGGGAVLRAVTLDL